MMAEKFTPGRASLRRPAAPDPVPAHRRVARRRAAGSVGEDRKAPHSIDHDPLGMRPLHGPVLSCLWAAWEAERQRQRLKFARIPWVALALLSTLPLASADAATKVLLIGDSVTAGFVSGPPGASYPEVLQAALGSGYTVIAEGCGGSSSLDWHPEPGSPVSGCGLVPHYTEFAQSHLPAEFAVVLLGTNDALGFFETGPTAANHYANTIFDLVEALRLDGAGQVILMSAPSLCESADEEAKSLLSAYATATDIICRLTDTSLCGPDLHELLDPELDFAKCDIHPNAGGHAAIGLALADVIRSPRPGGSGCGLGSEASVAILAWWTCRRRRGTR